MEADAFDGFCAEAAGLVGIRWTIGLDEDGVQLDVAGRYFEASGHGIEELFQDARAVHADDTVVRASHADIGDVGGAVGKNVFVGSGDVGVRPDDCSDASIEVYAEGNLFACGFGVHVDEHERDVCWKYFEYGIGFFEGIVDGWEEDAALQIENGEFYAAIGSADVKTGTRIFFGEIVRAEKARFMGHEVHDFLAIPAVIAAGDDGDALLKQFFSDAGSDAETGSGVFAIGDDKIDGALLDEVGEAFTDDVAAG